MILLQFPTFLCTKCYFIISPIIIRNGALEKDYVEFKHLYKSGMECEDEGKILQTTPLQNFLVSDFHN